MKKLVSLVLAGTLALGLAACGEQPQPNQNNNDVKVLPKPQEQVMAVESIEELHNGRALDISPDGKTLLFSWNEDVQDADPNSEITPSHHLYTMNLNDKSVVKISNAEDYKHQGLARYSPDGKYIAFMENIEEMFTPYVMTNDVMADKKKISEESLLTMAGLSWSQDSEYFAVSYRGLSNGQVIMYNPQGSKVASFAGEPDTIMAMPQFYNSDYLMYLKNDTTFQPKVAAQNINTGEEKEIVEALGGSFAVSPNKQRLAYVSESNDGKPIIRVDAIDSDLNIGANVAEVNTGYGTTMTWSPDSRHLLYNDSGNLWALNPETGEKVQLASGMQFILNLLWVSDKEIIFSGVPTEDDNYTLVTYRITLQ